MVHRWERNTNIAIYQPKLDIRVSVVKKEWVVGDERVLDHNMLSPCMSEVALPLQK